MSIESLNSLSSAETIGIWAGLSINESCSDSNASCVSTQYYPCQLIKHVENFQQIMKVNAWKWLHFELKHVSLKLIKWRDSHRRQLIWFVNKTVVSSVLSWVTAKYTKSGAWMWISWSILKVLINLKMYTDQLFEKRGVGGSVKYCSNFFFFGCNMIVCQNKFGRF